MNVTPRALGQAIDKVYCLRLPQHRDWYLGWHIGWHMARRKARQQSGRQLPEDIPVRIPPRMSDTGTSPEAYTPVTQSEKSRDRAENLRCGDYRRRNALPFTHKPCAFEYCRGSFDEAPHILRILVRLQRGTVGPKFDHHEYARISGLTLHLVPQHSGMV